MAIGITFNEDQQLIQDSARDFFARESTATVVRGAETAAEDFPLGLWRGMAELGWLGMSFPEAHGGSGCSLLDLVPLYQELGRHLAPVPLLDAVGLCGSLIAETGSEQQKKDLLPRIAAGELVVLPAVMEKDGLYGARGIALRAEKKDGGYVLEGSKVLVPCARAAGLLVVAARTGAGKDDDGISLFLVDPKSKGVSIEPTPTFTGERLYAVTFAGAAVPASALLGAEGRGWKPLDEAQMRAAVLQSAVVAGAGERVLEMTADYAKNRVQFGKPIGSYQAVQYLVTDIAIDMHLARLLMLQAAWRASAGLPWLREAAMAKAAACKAAVTMIHQSHEAHAGIGFIMDYDLQLYTRRAKHWEWHLGDYQYHLGRSLIEAGI